MTRKLRKLWTKYCEAKGELDGAWGDWAAEKEEMLDSVRMLQQQLTLKDLVIQAFIPPQDVQKVHLTACRLATGSGMLASICETASTSLMEITHDHAACWHRDCHPLGSCAQSLVDDCMAKGPPAPHHHTFTGDLALFVN